MWTCPKCGREFTKQNQDHYCGKAPKTIDEYIAEQPEKCQPYLNELRKAIQAAIHLPYDKPLPVDLIKSIAKWCYEADNL